jgi:predicted ester cyclase
MTNDRGAGSDGGTPSPNKQLVHRLVDDVINARRFESLDGLATSRLAPKLRTAFEQFRAAFPDWHQEIVELVEEGDTVVARFRCTGTQASDWQGLSATGRAMDVDEVSFIRITDGRISGIWGLEDTWTRIRQLVGDDVTVGELGSLG